jgi:hypothetical protein
MLNPNNISKTEQQFIRTYVAAMKRDYYLIWSVLDLMHPEHLGIKEIVTAARLARELQLLQAAFDGKLLALQKKHKLKQKSFSLPEPTVDELAELFTLSFFKVITTTPKGGKKNDGWFSGEPESWKEIAHAVQSIDVNKLPKIISTYIATIIQLFKPFGGTAPMADPPVNPYWQLPYGHKNYKPQQDDDQYFEDDDEYDDD